ncbi:hypothetical protein R0135_05500 [Congregibacter variabilis]|uniref:Lipoprotein SmpA/OmlA domain-containing protein n=1 Tax=Congregibacter variabilis TaxID=3081200 RepID=A0ABZ0I714_9GAMM|nr:hypothetical protein R0135_05500 [Congregibacter sp. IMCC43200]
MLCSCFRSLIVLAVLLLTACAQYDSERGVEVNWDKATLDSFQEGVTTRSQVMAELGPPSQLVSLGDESVLYYLNESSQGQGLILLLYNRFDMSARYDRAVFIFDEDDLLSDYSGWVVPADED